MGTWTQGIRDKEFLVGMRLRNLEPDDGRGKKAEVGDEGEDEED